MITFAVADIITLILGFIVALISSLIAVRLSNRAIADLIAFDLCQQTERLREESRIILAEIKGEE
jgi:hypothetical protein